MAVALRHLEIINIGFIGCSDIKVAALTAGTTAEFHKLITGFRNKFKCDPVTVLEPEAAVVSIV